MKFDPIIGRIYNSHMEIEKSTVDELMVADTEVEKDPVCIMVSRAYEEWSADSGDIEAVNRINSALSEACGAGVGISVKISEDALKHSKLVERRSFRKLRKLDPTVRDGITLSTIREVIDSPYYIEGRVFSTGKEGFLHLSFTNADKHKKDRRHDLAFLRPEDIESFTPIEAKE
jgi:hypothetical protein